MTSIRKVTSSSSLASLIYNQIKFSKAIITTQPKQAETLDNCALIDVEASHPNGKRYRLAITELKD